MRPPVLDVDRDEPQIAEEALLSAAQNGDKKALEALLERHQGKVFRFGMSMCRDPEDAKDVLQDTLLAAALGIRDFRGASSLSTWLYTIARSYCIKRRRKRKHAPTQTHSLDDAPRPETAQLSDPRALPDEALAGKELQAQLQEAIGALEPMYREVLVLRDVEGLTAPEVAGVLGIGVPAVKTRLHRARKAVRATLEPVLSPLPAPAAAAGCPDVLTLFSKHLENEIDASTCEKMERHLESCPRCRHRCDSLKGTLALCRTAGAHAEVPDSVKSSLRIALHDFLSVQG